MAEASSPPPEASPSTGNHPKRRKIRRGTLSCWECKRRKIRCSIVESRHYPCEGCKLRGNNCVGQDIVDEAESLRTSRRVRDRLGRVETLVEQLVNGAPGQQHDRSSSPSRSKRPPPSQSEPGTPSGSLSYDAPQTNNIALIPDAVSRDRPVPAVVNDAAPIADAVTPDRSVSATVDVPAPVPDAAPNGNEFQKVTQALLSAWPCKTDVESIVATPLESTAWLHGILCNLHNDDPAATLPSVRQMLQTPSERLGPVAVARQLLVLASYIQSLAQTRAAELEGQGIDLQRILSNAVKAAHNHVSCNEALASSTEGIEYLLVESMLYHAQSDLRQSWLTIRQAMLHAQLMGLQRRKEAPPAGTSGLHTMCTLSRHVWFRLVHRERYLSLMLGLPPGTSDEDIADPDILATCSSTEQLQRLECAAAGRILRRNQAEKDNFEVTEEIDRLLQKASACLPPQWWLIPDFTLSLTPQAEVICDSFRLMHQLTYYHLVVRLHLPNFLRPGLGRRHEYSKFAVINASRDVVSRFIAYRKANMTQDFYTRGLDFLMFISSTVLCLTHINAHQLPQSDHDMTLLNSLAHQRPVDRGMVEMSCETIQRVGQNGDAATLEMAGILQHLLAIESNAAAGVVYTVTSTADNDEGKGCGGEMNTSGKVLHVYIPSFGTVRIERVQGPDSPESDSAWQNGIRDSVPHQQFSGSAGLHLNAQEQTDSLPTYPITGYVSDQSGIPEAQQWYPGSTAEFLPSNLNAYNDGFTQLPSLSTGSENGYQVWNLEGEDAIVSPVL